MQSLEIAQQLQKKSNAKQRVLFRLWQAKKNNEIFWLQNNPPVAVRGGWLPLFALTSPLIGGSEASRRKREITEHHGIPIEHKIHSWRSDGATVTEEKPADRVTHLHRLECDPEDINWHEVLENRHFVFEPEMS